MESKISKTYDNAVKKESEKIQSLRPKYLDILSKWVATIEHFQNFQALEGRTVTLLYLGDKNICDVCQHIYPQCACVEVPSVSIIKEFFSEYFRHEAVSFVRRVERIPDPDGEYTADYKFECFVTFGESHEGKILRMKEEIRRRQQELAALTREK